MLGLKNESSAIGICVRYSYVLLKQHSLNRKKNSQISDITAHCPYSKPTFLNDSKNFS